MSNEFYDELEGKGGDTEVDAEAKAKAEADAKAKAEAEEQAKAEADAKAKPKGGSRRATAEKNRESKEAAAAKVSASATKHDDDEDEDAPRKTIREYEITPHDSSHYPPGGLVIGLNGKFKRIQPEQTMWLNQYWKEILDHAVIGEPRRDPKTGQVIGRRNVTRFPYTIGEIRDVEV